MTRALFPDRNPAGLEYLRTLPFGRIRGGGAFAGQVAEICEILRMRTRTMLEADLLTNLVHSVRASCLAAFLPQKESAELSTESISEISHPEFARLDRVICSGYGWKDFGINEMFIEWIQKSDQKRILVLESDNSQKYPLVRKLIAQWTAEYQGKTINHPYWLSGTDPSKALQLLQVEPIRRNL